MPVIKVSNEAYQELLRRQAKDGNVMSIVMDRLIAHLKEVEDEKRERDKNRKPIESGAEKRARESDRKRGNRAKETSSRFLGIEGLSPD